ncbi:LysR family transcriptional regulator [Paractinoplanes atraurantiacus]|uniref:DNA-binding transcriptional regulator, LysR family n=1 Tax=Paractinoplanes atraurantiacus TaxID=1036182 RepID=A0A285JQ16_9ACTN|nr:LysR substrate-binding domain-containing protein [Actinoplanes atraurantiacus]SNY62412.1 DNA-binding transcriptional regulator, LysR family [Actinoplanes atraurantiacus]
MELRQLEYFVTVAEEANFTRAAEKVHISQSGVSAQVKALEHELGAELFDRSGRVARLTEAGLAALPYAQAALDAAADLRQAVDEVKGLVRGHVTVGMVTGCEVTPLFAGIAGFHGEHPGIEIELTESDSADLVAGVRTGAIDIALVGVAGEPPEHLVAHIIVSEGLVALFPEGEASDRICLADLMAYPIVTLPPGTGIRAVLDEACVAARLIPDVALVASAPGTVVELASRGMGVAVLSESMATAFPHLKAVPIDDVRIPALLALVWRKRTSVALAALLPHLQRAFAVDNHAPVDNQETLSAELDNVSA